MRKLAIALTFSLIAAPALAGGMFDLPRLDWPTDSTISGSTMGCVQTVDTATAGAESCK